MEGAKPLFCAVLTQVKECGRGGDGEWMEGYFLMNWKPAQ